MTDYPVQVSISIPICGDRSLALLNPPAGFTFAETPLDDYPHKERIVDGDGNTQIDFRWAIHEDKILSLEYSDTKMVSFDDGLQNLQGLNHGAGLIIFETDPRLKEFAAKALEQIESFFHDQLFKFFAMLRVFKEGDFCHRLAFRKMTVVLPGGSFNIIADSWNIDELTLLQNPLVISPTEARDFQIFLADNNEAYDLLENIIIKDFEYTYRIFDEVTAFKNVISSFEALLIPDSNRVGPKKFLLGNNVACLIENDPTKMKGIAHAIADCYEDRNKAMHAGDRSRITKQKLRKVQEISRKVIKAEFNQIRAWLPTHQGATFSQFKTDEMIRITRIRNTRINSGDLENNWQTTP